MWACSMCSCTLHTMHSGCYKMMYSTMDSKCCGSGLFVSPQICDHFLILLGILWICESSETTDVYYIFIGAFFITHVLRNSPPTLQKLILSSQDISCVRNTTPHRSFEVLRKIFYSPLRGGRPLHDGSDTAGGAIPTWGFSRSRLNTSYRVPGCNLKTFPFSSTT